jgi:tRNA pseudouridine38-40 synthase
LSGSGGRGGAEGAAPADDPVAGRTFVITGSLTAYANRDELRERIENAGGKVTGSVTGRTDYLVNNDPDSASSKNKKAHVLGVKILSEAEMNALLAGGVEPDRSGKRPSMRNVLITIEYDGSAFHGWQRQKGVGGGADRARTVQGVLEEALARVCGCAVSLYGTSRTDAGVHALGQAASFEGAFGIPADRIPIAANDLLEDVRVLRASDVPEGFHARYDARGKTYLYRICSPLSGSGGRGGAEGAAPDIFLRNYRCLLNERPDEGKMEQAARLLTGTRDYAAFRAAGGAGSAGDGSADTVRTLTEITVHGADAMDTKGNPVRETEIRVTGTAFLYNMVRILAGTLIETGLGRRAPEEMTGILESGDRAKAGHTAPAAGLYLERVYF